jgi:RNA polymerase sigma factor (sigma-70 family)
MSATAEPPSLDDLMTRAAWARRLAYRLVHHADAPDLLQEAWIAARERDRPDHVPPAAWFGGTLRILGMRRLRARARRQAREAQAGAEAPAAVPSPEALLERAQLQRLLSDLVLALAEPHRSTVLLRYEEGLSSAEIARRLAIPAGTVRWRLKEALDELRQRLDEREQGKGRWAVVLAPLAGPRRRSPLVTVASAAALSTAIVSGLFALRTHQELPASPAAGAPVASSPVPRGPDHPQKETEMKRIVPAYTMAAVLALAAHADAGARGPVPPSKVARFQVPLGGAPILGPPGAKVTILEFTDYECPFCARGAETCKAVVAAFPGEVRYQVINFPLAFHRQAALAARAALAAAQQGKYWEMHDRLFAHTDQLARADLEEHARALGLDLARFRADLDGATVARQMEIDEATVASVHANGTPTYFINGRMIGGSRPLEEFKARVTEEIAYANQVLAAGVPPEELYNEITSRGAAEIPESAPPQTSAVTAAMKNCVRDQKILRTLAGASISPGGTFSFPKGATYSNEQRKVLGCLAKELADKGFGIKL